MRIINCLKAGPQRFGQLLVLGIGIVFLSTSPLIAGTTADGDATPADGKSTADSKTTPPPTATEEPAPELKNWIEVGIGGLIIDGDDAQFKQEHRMSGDIYGGIEDMHWEHAVGKGTLMIDGRAMFDADDYNVKVDLTLPNIGYLRGGYTEFRSWYDGNGGFFPHHNAVYFEPPDQEMHVDRGEAWVELGLRLPDWPEITIHYSHLFREGRKDSTIWGDTTLTGLPSDRNPARKIAPAYRDIDETRDILSFDAAKTFGKTNIDLGMRAEWSNTDNRLQLWRGAGQIPPAVSAPGAERFITQREGNDLENFSGHVLTETRFTDNLWFTTGYSYSALNNDLSGTRIVGPDYNSHFMDTFPTLQSNDHAILNLAGMSQVDEHVFNSNLFWIPLKDLHAIAGFRYTHEEIDSASTFLDANTTTSPAPTHYTPAIPKSIDTSESTDKFAQRLELRYTAIKDWLFYIQGNWQEEYGDVREHILSGTLVNNVPTPADQGEMRKDTTMLEQKYQAGVTWYPTARLSLAAQYYYKIIDYDNDFHSELATSTDVPAVAGTERNQRLLGQDWNVHDANIRITVRPKIPETLGTISFVTRYDYMESAVSGKWGVSPAGPPPAVPPAPPAIPTGTVLGENRSGLITSHIISESLTWNPLARLYLQATGSYVLSQTETPAGSIDLIYTGTTQYNNPTVINFRNDYWTATGSAGYLIDDKTTLLTEYTFYRANDYVRNPRESLPYSMAATEHTASASVSRQITLNLRLMVRYTYFNYTDELFGGHNNYEVHSIYSGLQFRF